jgi:hypothetical protein
MWINGDLGSHQSLQVGHFEQLWPISCQSHQFALHILSPNATTDTAILDGERSALDASAIRAYHVVRLRSSGGLTRCLWPPISTTGWRWSIKLPCHFSFGILIFMFEHNKVEADERQSPATTSSMYYSNYNTVAFHSIHTSRITAAKYTKIFVHVTGHRKDLRISKTSHKMGEKWLKKINSLGAHGGYSSKRHGALTECWFWRDLWNAYYFEATHCGGGG